VGLGEIHGDIGPPDQIILTTAIAWVDGNADTCRYRNRVVVDDIRLGQMSTEFLCHLRSTFFTVDLWQQDDELVSAIATGRVRAADAGEQALRHALQEFGVCPRLHARACR